MNTPNDVTQNAPQNLVASESFQRVQLARHERRPYALDYIQRIFTDFYEIHGDRSFKDDPAIVAGFANFQGQPVVVIAHQKGRDVKERQARNFGMPKPEGYRKAIRVMQIAEKFNRPVITLVDTPGAYPGIDAEERGQAEAIAYNLREMARLKVPIIVTITGEGGSGGALAIGVGDVVAMLENSVYSVITPEGCAAILWKDAAMAPQAAANMKMTAPDLLRLGIIDRIVPEPAGGAQDDWDTAATLLAEHLSEALRQVQQMDWAARIEARYRKFRLMGAVDITA
ncbi:MAG: acetyl-CoA carboxylase carboxyltransferase subunit alpha [Acidobacteriota bacterium]